MKRDYNDTDKSPLAMENNSHFAKHQSMLESIPVTGKKLVFEQDNAKSSLLDESNIKEH
jgi:mannose/fructose/N-acetylgalactosamine-specific phosphotransferase system component IID